MAEPRAIHSHAIDDLRFIRDTMARAGQFSAIPGWGGVVMGVSALVASALAGPVARSPRWLTVWLTDAADFGIAADADSDEPARISRGFACPQQLRVVASRMFGAVMLLNCIF